MGFFTCPAFAALALDASTPAAVKSNVQNLTTASFTPPAGSVLYILVAINSLGGGNTDTVTGISDSLGGPGLTYIKQLSLGNTTNDCIVYLYTATVITSQSMTVTATQSNYGTSASYAYMKVLVVTGVNTSSPVGANGGGRGAAGVISDPYVSTTNNSWGWLLYADWNAAAIPTAGASQTLDDSYFIAGQDTYALIQQNATTASSGTSVTMSTTAPTSGAQTTHMYFEMKPFITTTQSIVQGNSVIAGNSVLN